MFAPRAARLLFLAAIFVIVGARCSSDSKRDQFYGTDVGVNWQPDDAAFASAPDVAREAATADGGIRDGGHLSGVDAGDGGSVDAGDAGDDAPAMDAAAGQD